MYAWVLILTLYGATQPITVSNIESEDGCRKLGEQILNDHFSATPVPRADKSPINCYRYRASYRF
jgi:hypothetical protein